MWVFNFCYGCKFNTRLQLPEAHSELFLCNEMSFKGKEKGYSLIFVLNLVYLLVLLETCKIILKAFYISLPNSFDVFWREY